MSPSERNHSQTRRAEPVWAKLREDTADGGDDGLVGVEADLAIGLAPNKADRQSSAEFATRRLVANAAVEAGPQHMQFGLAHGALEPEQQAIIEERRMIDAVGIADQRIGEAAEFDEAMPIGVVAREARDLEPEHEADMGERDFGGEAGEARSRDKAGAGEPEVLIDDDDAIGGPAEFTGFAGKRILSIGQLAIVLDLGGAGLAQVDDRLAGEMAGRDLGALIHRFPPSSIRPRACGR